MQHAETLTGAPKNGSVPRRGRAGRFAIQKARSHSGWSGPRVGTGGLAACDACCGEPHRVRNLNSLAAQLGGEVLPSAFSISRHDAGVCPLVHFESANTSKRTHSHTHTHTHCSLFPSHTLSLWFFMKNKDLYVSPAWTLFFFCLLSDLVSLDSPIFCFSFPSCQFPVCS